MQSEVAQLVLQAVHNSYAARQQLMQHQQHFQTLLVRYHNAAARQQQQQVQLRVQKKTRGRPKRPRRQRTVWVHHWLSERERHSKSHYYSLMEAFRHDCPEQFRRFTRISMQMFDEMHDRLTPQLTKQNTNYREALEVGLKLAVTLRYLATGASYTMLGHNFTVSNNAISMFVPDVCQAIINEYGPEVLTAPSSVAEWQAIEKEFRLRWNLPNCLGAIDGKHIRINKPPGSGSLFHNYKGFFSIVLLGLVDANYKFIWADVGGSGSNSDAQIFNSSQLKEKILDKSIQFPPDKPLPNDDKPFPHFLVGDDAFALATWMMKPYARFRGLSIAERIFNYRLSRARRVVENAFGIMALRWQVLLTFMRQKHVDTTRLVTATCVVLHNLMRTRYPTHHNDMADHFDRDGNLRPGIWRNMAQMHEVETVRAPSREKTDAKKAREYLRLWENSPAGSVPWQHDKI